MKPVWLNTTKVLGKCVQFSSTEILTISVIHVYHGIMETLIWNRTGAHLTSKQSRLYWCKPLWMLIVDSPLQNSSTSTCSYAFEKYVLKNTGRLLSSAKRSSGIAIGIRTPKWLHSSHSSNHRKSGRSHLFSARSQMGQSMPDGALFIVSQTFSKWSSLAVSRGLAVQGACYLECRATRPSF